MAAVLPSLATVAAGFSTTAFAVALALEFPSAPAAGPTKGRRKKTDFWCF